MGVVGGLGHSALLLESGQMCRCGDESRSGVRHVSEGGRPSIPVLFFSVVWLSGGSSRLPDIIYESVLIKYSFRIHLAEVGFF